jgi:hypothetical protein
MKARNAVAYKLHNTYSCFQAEHLGFSLNEETSANLESHGTVQSLSAVQVLICL